MATVYVPTGMRPLTAGERIVCANGHSIREIVDDLEMRYPGFYESLIEHDELKPGLTIAIDSVEQPLGLLAKVPEGAEIHIIPAMAGGR